MSYSFSNKVAIITGSSRGIGKAIAIALASRGAKVVINGRDEIKLGSTLSELKDAGYDCMAIAGDISNYDFCEKMIEETVEKYGSLDILINNAGLSNEGRVDEVKAEVFKKVFDVNVLGVIYPTKAAIPYLKQTEGRIAITGSIAGFMGLPDYSAYSATKASLTTLAQSLRIELAMYNIHIGLNYVGFAENDTQKTFINKAGNVEVMPVRSNFKKMPLGKVASIVLNGIAKRKNTQVLSGLGYGTYIISRFAPGLMEKIMTRRYLKNQKKS